MNTHTTRFIVSLKRTAASMLDSPILQVHPSSLLVEIPAQIIVTMQKQWQDTLNFTSMIKLVTLCQCNIAEMTQRIPDGRRITYIRKQVKSSPGKKIID